MAATPRLVVVAVLVLVAACSSGDDGAAETDAPGSGSAAESAPAAESGTDSPAGQVTLPPEAPATTMAVAETGVPGLDSDDSFCAAWSRFGGSWQVLVQAGASLDPAEVARLEVVASALVEDAYNDVFAAWPAELETERDVVADGYFGAFRRRSDDAAFALSNAGATDDDRARLATAWADALERYDPAAPAVDVAVPDELGPLVDTAAGAFAQQRVPLPTDPTMVITVETPLTDEFLASACPDQGWIVGQDVVEG